MLSGAKSITLTAEQVQELKHQFSLMRHDINNHLSLMVAAVELTQMNRDMTPRMLVTLGDVPPKITSEVQKFAEVFEIALGRVR